MADCFVKYIYQYKLSLAIVIVKIKSLFNHSIFTIKMFAFNNKQKYYYKYT